MRGQIIKRIQRFRGCDRATAAQIEANWFDEAWAKSLRTDDANHNQCDHNDATFRKYYQRRVDEFFSSPD